MSVYIWNLDHDSEWITRFMDLRGRERVRSGVNEMREMTDGDGVITRSRVGVEEGNGSSPFCFQGCLHSTQPNLAPNSLTCVPPFNHYNKTIYSTLLHAHTPFLCLFLSWILGLELGFGWSPGSLGLAFLFRVISFSQLSFVSLLSHIL